MRRIQASVVALLVLGVACSKSVDVDKVPVGTEVEVTKDDGGVVKGTIEKKTEDDVVLNLGKTSRPVPRGDIADVRVVSADSPKALPAIARFREYTLAAGTPLKIRLQTGVGSETSREGDPVTATLAEAVMLDNEEVLPDGSTVRGQVTAAQPAGKVKGVGSLALHFSTVAPAGSAESTAIDADVSFVAESSKASDAKKIGIPAAGGAVVGAIIGGKKGAAIGGAIGGGAGAAVVLTSEGADVVLAKDTVLTIKLDTDVTVRVPITRG